jgi:hypothetical protein
MSEVSRLAVFTQKITQAGTSGVDGLRKDHFHSGHKSRHSRAAHLSCFG